MRGRIFIADRQNIFRLRKNILRRIVRSFFKIKNVSFDVSLVLADNRLIRKLNRVYRRRDYATDVLAFPLASESDVDNMRGEIIISVEKAQENAAWFGQEEGKELALYVVHGLLHLMGYRDYPPSAARRMRKEEERILQALDPALFGRLLAEKA